MKALISYASISGNTEEVMEIIKRELEANGVEVSVHYIDYFSPIVKEDLEPFNFFIIGSYSWDLGHEPEEVVEYVEELGKVSMPVYVFATGDTQFGDDVYCIAGDRIAVKLKSTFPVLKIEQSPRGEQTKTVVKWINAVYKKEKIN